MASAGTGSNLIIDVMNYDPSILKAILYAVGNTVVCETIAEAKRLAFAKDNAVKSNLDPFNAFWINFHLNRRNSLGHTHSQEWLDDWWPWWGDGEG